MYPNAIGTVQESEMVERPFWFLDVLMSCMWEYSSHLIKQTLLSEWKNMELDLHANYHIF